MAAFTHWDVRKPLRRLYVDDTRLCFVGFRDGKANPVVRCDCPFYRFYVCAFNRERPIQSDTSSPSCGGPRLNYWTRTVVEHDMLKEGLFASDLQEMSA
jgi:hypothetical protein